MKAIITADIVNSRAISPEVWLIPLKEILNTLGVEYKVWEIYRGDSLQVIVNAKEVLETALLLKATIKQIANLDIRMAIGLGEVSYQSDKLTTSNGTAFINSGTCFEGLKNNTLAILTPNTDFNKVMNIMLGLATLNMDTWKPATAKIVKAQLEFPEAKQQDLAEKLQKNQSNISYGLKRAGFDEIMKCISYYKQEIEKICYS